MNLDTSTMFKVRVYANGDNHILLDWPNPCTYMSDDYEMRITVCCNTCDSFLQVHHGEPFASCDCGTTEWYK